MQAIKDNLKILCAAIGVSGLEHVASNKAAEMLREFTNEVTVDYFGNVVGWIRSKNPNAKTLLLDAHIDEIGLIVVAIDDKGFLKVAGCGGVDRRLLAAQEVTVHCKNGDLLGIVGSKPPHLEKGDDAKQVPEIEDIFIDIGFNEEQAKERVSLGDRATIRSTFRELSNDCVSSKALDDRSGVVAILEALRMLKSKDLDVNIAALFSCQEEVGKAGATVGAYGIEPDIGIAVDVGHALTADAKPHKCGKLAEGVMIDVGILLCKELGDSLIKVAKDNNIRHQIEVGTGGTTGTNADPIIVTKNGTKTAVLSIPLKYMHTPIELISVHDVVATATLIAKYAESVGKTNV